MKTKILFTLFIGFTLSTFAQFGPQQVISTTTPGAFLSFPADVDADGLIDIVTNGTDNYSLRYYRNLDGTGNFGELSIISNVPGLTYNLEFTDLDNDGDKDFLYITNNPSHIVWQENSNGAGTFASKEIIIQMNGKFFNSVVFEDIDNDGDKDLVFSASDTFRGWIYFAENLNGEGDFGSPTEIFEINNEYNKISLEDIDNDGKLDILATQYVLAQGELFWYKNSGNTIFEDKQTIFQFDYMQSGGTNIYDFSYEDMNGDGKKDIVINSADENFNYYTEWIENIDNVGTFGERNVMMTEDYNYRIHDLDNDGDLDMLVWNFQDLLGWKANDGQGVFGDIQIISHDFELLRTADACDINNDGYLDIISASLGDNKIAWYPNRILGIEEQSLNEFEIYPNPTDGFLNIASTTSINKVEISTLLGQKIIEVENVNPIDISQLANGVYLLKITDSNNTITTKKILKK